MELCDAGKFLEKLRIDLNISNQDIIDRVGISKPYFYYIKIGDRTISNLVETRLTKVLRMTPEQIKEWNKLVFVHNVTISNKISLGDFDSSDSALLLNIAIKLKSGDNSVKEKLNKLLEE